VDRLTRAAGRAEKRPDLYIVLGDCFVGGSQPERAAGYYEQALAANRSYSFVPFLNLAWTARRRGFDETALALLREANTRFPGNRRVIIELAKLLFSRGEKDEALRILDGYLAAHPDQFEARLLKLRFEDDSSSSDRVLLRLKDLFFENPKSERAAAVLTAKLIANQDLAGARAVLTYYGEVNGPAEGGRLAAAHGILVAVDGDLNRASSLFGEAVAREERWEFRYNRAAVLMEMGKIGEARIDLEQALVDLGNGTSGQERKSEALVHAQLAALFLKTENPAAAEREVRAALALDPSNERAYRVKRALVGEAGR
jgi:Tfp pilus assembly protein PilF